MIDGYEASLKQRATVLVLCGAKAYMKNDIRQDSKSRNGESGSEYILQNQVHLNSLNSRAPKVLDFSVSRMKLRLFIVNWISETQSKTTVRLKIN